MADSMKSFRISVLISILLLFFTILSFAGTRGKLAGTVTDRSTGQPLAGVNIYLDGSSFGAATNENGQYIIINIPPGVYTVTADYVGYNKQKVANIKIITDLTTRLNFKLQPTALQSEETITVIAQRPLIRNDVTSKLSVIDGSEIISMPVANFNEVVASQAGITTDAQGNLHFRGGRTSEVTFLIDGQPVENPINNSFGGLIDNYAIRELQVLSGTFNAEYGQAMSGIINIVTNDGSEDFKAKVEYTSPQLNESPYRKPNALVRDANPIYDSQTEARLFYHETDGLDEVDPVFPYEGNITGFFSGPLPAGIGSWFFSGEYLNQNSWLPFGYNFNRSAFGKITLPFSANRLSLSLQYSDQESKPYVHRYKYLPENYGRWLINSTRLAAQYNHVLSSHSYMLFNVSYLEHLSRFRVGDLHFTEYVFPELDDRQEFIIAGNSQSWSNFKSKTWNLKGEWVLQYGQHHEFKSGLEFSRYDLDVFDYTNEGNNPEEFFLNQYKKKPVTASLYVQDKIEYGSIILNAGVRVDYADVKSQGFADIENPLSSLKDTEPELKVSPRLGLAYPVSANTVLHFSYGHFLQFPNFQNIYQNLQFLQVDELARARLALVANPRVQSQKTISYEFGISQKLGDDIAIKASAYSKDITDLLGTIYVETLYRYAIFTNNDFARIQGADLSLEKRMGNYWTARFDYSYSVARGNEASPTEEAYNIFQGRERSIKEFYLDFDRRHDFSFNIMLAFPRQFGPEVAGLHPLADLNFSVLAQFSSGLPYTPVSDDRTKLFEKNSARMPWTKTVDIRLEKFIPMGDYRFSVFTEITNLFDWLNPLVVQPRTGKVWDDGKSYLFGSGEDARHNPNDVGPPRLVRVGISAAM